MRYSLDAFDKHGLLKPSPMLWLVLAFSAKAWIVFVMAGSSREQGSQLLTLFYPIKETLYVGFVLGLPSILLTWLSGLRHRNNHLINTIWRHGKLLLLVAYISDCLLQTYHLITTQGVFSWSNGVMMVLTIWLTMYLLRSTRVKNTFADKPVER
ncbi:hypothetical protein A3K86_12890 [Photobacterium jeanii]|uniref:DUF2919 domain-containing protein n=1 Tax=Photobacterium jeanii TaxID=858640 RepID=A0A178K990_9GAMM|nr:DUF2919 domain-containing protein [Photobacterium jeanii]OAN13919.1 hypothetical protein A3K86_12890 [Photobacterium jeanii]PST89904.1 DUF2919 domain-containing protein [Photobacterium jeanii]